jgi:hypothetical protein
LELELKMISIEAVTADWNALSDAEQLQAWKEFIVDLDAGEGAFHRSYLVLMPLWGCGDVPALVEEVQLARAIDEAAEDAAWELQHSPLGDGWMDYSMRAAEYGEPVF